MLERPVASVTACSASILATVRVATSAGRAIRTFVLLAVSRGFASRMRRRRTRFAIPDGVLWRHGAWCVTIELPTGRQLSCSAAEKALDERDGEWRHLLHWIVPGIG